VLSELASQTTDCQPCSSLRSNTAQQQNQRSPEADRSEEEGAPCRAANREIVVHPNINLGQGGRYRPAEAESRPREGEEVPNGQRGREGGGSQGQDQDDRQHRARLGSYQR
jgi:hypothetical protein